MLPYCLKCKKDAENVNSKVLKTKNGRAMLLSEQEYALVKITIYEKIRSKRIRSSDTIE